MFGFNFGKNENFINLEGVKNIAMRSLLALSLFSSPVFTTGCGGIPESKKVQNELENLKVEKDRLSEEYRNNPEIILNQEFFEKICEIFMYEEYLGYCEREDKDINREFFEKVVAKDFLQKILENQDQEVKTIEDVFEIAFKLKELFQKEIGREDSYEKNHRNFVDPSLEKAFQCRSGTENLLYLLSRTPGVQDIAKLAYIYTRGHVLVGLIVDGKVYGVESTSSGNGFVQFGEINKISIPISIIDYRQALVDSVIGGVPEINKVILDNPEKRTESLGTIDQEEKDSLLGVHSSQYSFGKSNVTPGRKKLFATQEIKPENYGRDFNSYYDDSDSKDGDSLPREIQEKIISFNLEYQGVLNSFWDKHVDLCNNPPASEEDFRNQAKEIMEDIKEFLENNQAQGSYETLEKELEEVGRSLSLKSPNQIHDVILHNLNVTLNRKY